MRIDEAARLIQRFTIPILVVVAVLLRLTQLTELEFDIDEACSYLYATSPLGVMKSLESDANAPIYFYLLKGWIALFSGSEFAVRGLSVLMGVLMIVALPLVMRGFEFSEGAIRWGVALAVFSPLHIYYSQNARGYALVHVAMLTLLWAFAVAVRRKDWMGWLILGVGQLIALSTHNMFLLVILGLWAGSYFLNLGRVEYRRWLVVQAVVGVMYLPWLLRALGAASSPGLWWIVQFWEATPPIMAIPRSLEVFGIGGRLPSYFRDLASTPIDPIRYLSIGFFALSAGALFFWRRGEQSAWRKSGRLKFLLVCLLLPLGFQFAYSLVRSPIYLVGRYDTIVFPVYLMMMGAGIGSLQEVLRSLDQRLPRIVLFGVFPLLVFFSLLPRYRPLPDAPREVLYRTRSRGELLEREAKADDLIICLGIDGSKILYECAKRGVEVDLITYPRATQEHIGWFNPRLAFSDWDQLQREAVEIGSMVKKDYRGVWVFFDSESRALVAGGRPEDSEYTRSAMMLLLELRKTGMDAILNGPLDVLHFQPVNEAQK